jgi:glycosyltransferase involved in cell wall biosynthesis
MRKVIMITDVDFWLQGAGHRTRICTLVIYLANHTNLTVAFVGMEAIYSETYLSEYLKCNFKFLEKKKFLNQIQYAKKLKMLFNTNDFDVCIVEYVHNSYYLNIIPQNVITILDTHDIISERNRSFKKFNYDIIYDISKKQEYELFRCYDYIVAICDDDYNTLKNNIEIKRLILAPHPAKPIIREIRPLVTNMGFFGSSYLPNIDAITWFIRNIWPNVQKNFDGNLSIYGNVAHEMQVYSDRKIKLIGFVPDLNEVFSQIDISINPVRFGGGVKIKNIESLANGIPLITTRHGARGLEEGVNKAFLVAENKMQFIQLLDKLINNYRLRKELNQNALKYVGQNLSEKKCYTQLLSVINNNSK